MSEPKTKRPVVVASIVGAGSAIGFLLIWLGVIFACPDPQSGIGLFLAPFYAAIIATLSFIATFGVLSARRGGDEILIVLTVIAVPPLLAFLGYIASEIWQAM